MNGLGVGQWGTPRPLIDARQRTALRLLKKRQVPRRQFKIGKKWKFELIEPVGWRV